MTIKTPSSGGTGQPPVWLKTIKKGEETHTEYSSQNPAETESTNITRSRNTERGLRSEQATNERKMKRSLKRLIARKNTRKCSRGETPLEPVDRENANKTQEK